MPGAHARHGSFARRGMGGPGSFRARRFVVPKGWIHDLLPILPIAIVNQHCDWRAERLAGAHAREKLDGIFLDLHPAAAAVPLLTPRELDVHVIGGEREACRHTLEDADEGGAM